MAPSAQPLQGHALPSGEVPQVAAAEWDFDELLPTARVLGCRGQGYLVLGVHHSTVHKANVAQIVVMEHG